MKRLRNEAPHRVRGGFTLVEILVAILITSIVAGVIYGAYMGSLKVIYSARTDADRANMARFILDRIASDLRCAFLRGYREWLVFVGLDSGEGSEGRDAVSFIAATHDRPERDAPESSLCEVSYFLESDGEEGFYVVRREDPTLDEDAFSGGEARIIGEGVAGLDFEYFDGESWSPSWDSREENELPRAARITLLFRTVEEEGEEGEETVRYTTYRTEVSIPLGGSWEEEEEEEEEQQQGEQKEEKKQESGGKE